MSHRSARRPAGANAAERPQASRRQSRSSSPQTGLALLRLTVGGLWIGMFFAAVPPARAIALHVRDVLFGAAHLGQSVEARRARVIEYAEQYGISLDLAGAIERAAVAEGIDPDLAFRVVEKESAFDSLAVSSAGAMGLTQLMPATAAWLQPGLTPAEAFDRDTNLRLGFRYLRSLIDLYDGDTRMALLAYNRGPGTVDRIRAAGGDPGNGYADRVLNRSGVAPYQGNGLLADEEILPDR